MGCVCMRAKNTSLISPKKSSDIRNCHDHKYKYSSTNEPTVHGDDISFTHISIDNMRINDDVLWSFENMDPYAFTPEFINRRQAAIDNLSYQNLVQSWSPNSLPELVEQLKSAMHNKYDVDQHWLIFYWIAMNIRYDTDSFFKNKIAEQSAEAAFRTRTGVYSGFSRLYKHLCDKLNLRCVEVKGFSKGYGYTLRASGQELEEDHAWNMITIANHKYLLDPTWGAGYLTADKEFKKELNTFYFLTKPEHMIYDHLPIEDQYQLLREPITRKQYIQLPKTNHTFFELNLELIEPVHRNFLSVSPSKHICMALIRAPIDLILTGKLENSRNEEVSGGHDIYYDQYRKIWICKFAPNENGYFEASIYGKRRMHAGEYPEVVMFQINAKGIPKTPITFARKWETFHDLNLELRSPLGTDTIDLDRNQSYGIALITAPDDILISCRTEFNQHIKERGSLAQFDPMRKIWFCLFSAIGVGKHLLTVFAKRINEDIGHSAVQLYMNVPLSVGQQWVFPTIYGTFNKNKCYLYEPLHGELKRGSTVRFHLYIPGGMDVQLMIDERQIYIQGPEVDRIITVGENNVFINVKFDEQTDYIELIKYDIK